MDTEILIYSSIVLFLPLHTEKLVPTCIVYAQFAANITIQRYSFAESPAVANRLILILTKLIFSYKTISYKFEIASKFIINFTSQKVKATRYFKD